MSIPVNIEDLLSAKVVEGDRIEYKEGWNPAPIMRTICAFANDFYNYGSGYIVVGVEEEDGIAKRPVKGINPKEFESVQKALIGYCNLIQPAYVPHISLEEVDDVNVIVIWSPAGSLRPYKVPDDVTVKHKNYHFRIRQYSSSVVPNEEQEHELIQLTAKIPFDDRVNTHASIEDLDFALMREHLYRIKSRLFDESSKMGVKELAQAMNLCEGADEHLFPKNVGLLMFSSSPVRFFPAVQIDVVHFPQGAGAKEFTEKTFDGPIQKQLTDTLSYIKSNFIEEHVIKVAGQAEAIRQFNYPYEAIEEALANAVYHRNYEIREPIEVRILPESIEIVSYNGVDPSLKQQDFDSGRALVRRYRNRRIGEFLKELSLTEGRGTGIPAIYEAIEKNGSPAPRFNTDDPERRFFFVAFDALYVLDDQNDTSDKTHEGVNEGVNEGVKSVLNYIEKHPGCRVPVITEATKIPAKTIERHIKTLRKEGRVEFFGAPKTGGYRVIAHSMKLIVGDE